MKYITISTWAKLAGINRESVYKRFKSGKLKVSDLCEHPLIDIEQYPPFKLKHRRRSYEFRIANKSNRG